MSRSRVVLRGCAWGHSRGYVPMVATAQRFSELHPTVTIEWEQRSLQAFADFSIAELASRYDLLVIDHPWVPHAAERRILLPLDGHLPAGLLDDLRAHEVGASLRSYLHAGALWALPIDAASPVASYRPDLFEAEGLVPPRTWEAFMSLVRGGRVVMPAIPLDLLGHFNMFCGVLGEDPFRSEGRVVSEAIGVAALEVLRDLALQMPGAIFDLNPIRTYEAMTATDDYLYCFSGYGYSNYARRGYARRALRFTTMPPFNGERFRGTLGGAGLAISAGCRHVPEAAAYAAYVAGRDCQSGLYVESGGQPAHRAAWLDDRVNGLCGGFFRDTLADLDRAFLRPRYDGYMLYQDRAPGVVWRYVRDGGRAAETLRAMDDLYRQSRKGATAGPGSLRPCPKAQFSLDSDFSASKLI